MQKAKVINKQQVGICSEVRRHTSWAWTGVATLPVPMAHTGSYASTTLVQSDILSVKQRSAPKE